MKLKNILHFFLFVGMAFVFTNCGSPELRRDSSEEVSAETEPEPPMKPEPVPVPEPVVEKIELSKPEPIFVEPSEPYFKVERKDSKIIIDGAIKSISHQQRIGEQLAAAFAKDEIVNNLEVDFDRYAVPWTGRVTEQFLIPFLRETEDPYVEYKEGIITLKGTVKREKEIKVLTEMGIDTFASTFSKGIENQLKAKGK